MRTSQAITVRWRSLLSEIAARDRHDYGGAMGGASLHRFEFQVPAEHFGSLSDSRDSDTSRLTLKEMIQHPGRYATAMIAHRQGECLCGMIHFNFYVASSRVKMHVCKAGLDDTK